LVALVMGFFAVLVAAFFGAAFFGAAFFAGAFNSGSASVENSSPG